MELYFPEAIVLDREDANGFDSRYSIYAKAFGKFLAKATSARKITSKLAPHLEPGNLVQIRVVGNGGFQVVDVLKREKLDVRCGDLYLLNQMLPEHDFDFAIWEELLSGVRFQMSGFRERGDEVGERSVEIVGQARKNLDWRKVLRILGWDPEHAACEICGSLSVSKFAVEGQVFACTSCGESMKNFVFL